MKPVIYLIGSLRNPEIPKIANKIREHGFEVFDDWWSASEDADDWWQHHEAGKGHSYKEAIYGHHADCVFSFDYKHLNRADIGVLVLPAGKSGHLELGYMIGRGKPGFILFDEEPGRFDVMYRFATDVCFSIEELVKGLNKLGSNHSGTVTNHLQSVS